MAYEWNDFLRQMGYSGFDEEGAKVYQDTGDGERRQIWHPGEEFDEGGPVRQWFNSLNAVDQQGRPIYGTEFFTGQGKPGSTFFDENGVDRYRVGTDQWSPTWSQVGGTPDQLSYDPRYGYSIPMSLQNEWAKRFQPNSVMDAIAPFALIAGPLAGTALAGGFAGAGTGAAGPVFPTAAIEGGLAAGALEGGLAAGAGALPESYWSMLAETATGAPSAAAGTVGTGAQALGTTEWLSQLGYGSELGSLFTGTGEAAWLSAAPAVAPAGGAPAVAQQAPSAIGNYGVNAGGLDGALADSVAQYTGGMGALNPLTTAGGAAAGGGLLQSVLDFTKQYPLASSIGSNLLGGLLQGAMAPSLARDTAQAQAQARAEAERQIEEARRQATSFSGVRFGVKPTGKMLRTPRPINR